MQQQLDEQAKKLQQQGQQIQNLQGKLAEQHNPTWEGFGLAAGTGRLGGAAGTMEFGPVMAPACVVGGSVGGLAYLLTKIWECLGVTRAFNWLNSRPGLLLCSILILALACVEGYGYINTHKVMYLGFAVLMVALAITTWIQLARHRDDPTWPPKRALAPRDSE